mmetsp:Transcript_30383/g.70029  ORF Transcript_30383/g.70029 Transcript_30383/m.70029 type:complete len:87 (+) Transcript_30383:237-497(+)
MPQDCNETMRGLQRNWQEPRRRWRQKGGSTAKNRSEESEMDPFPTSTSCTQVSGQKTSIAGSFEKTDHPRDDASTTDESLYNYKHQ